MKSVTISISSGKGGVGKTSITVNLAYSLLKKGKRVLIIDGDLGLANVDILLRLSVKKTIRDVLASGDDPREAVIYVEKGLGVLPGSSGVPDIVTLGPEDRSQLADFIRELGAEFDYVLIDTSSGIGSSVLWFNTFASHNMVVLTSDPTSITDAYALIKVLSRDYGCDRFLMVFNQIRTEAESHKIFKLLQGVSQKFLNHGLTYFGAIPMDDRVGRAVLEQRPFVLSLPTGKASRAVFLLADQVMLLP